MSAALAPIPDGFVFEQPMIRTGDHLIVIDPGSDAQSGPRAAPRVLRLPHCDTRHSSSGLLLAGGSGSARGPD